MRPSASDATQCPLARGLGGDSGASLKLAPQRNQAEAVGYVLARTQNALTTCPASSTNLPNGSLPAPVERGFSSRPPPTLLDRPHPARQAGHLHPGAASRTPGQGAAGRNRPRTRRTGLTAPRPLRRRRRRPRALRRLRRYPNAGAGQRSPGLLPLRQRGRHGRRGASVDAAQQQPYGLTSRRSLPRTFSHCDTFAGDRDRLSSVRSASRLEAFRQPPRSSPFPRRRA